MKKRRLRKSLRKPLLIFGCIVAAILVFLVLDLCVFNNIHFLGVKSVNRDAKTYKTKTCLAFYPNTKDGKKTVKSLCDKTEEETIYDYALVPYGDYYLVEYGNNVHYYIDHDNNPLTITTVSEEGKTILSDYLRYDMKKDEIDEAYTLSFIEETSADKLDISNCTYSIEGQDLLVYYPKYDYTSKVPLKYIQKAVGINLNYKEEMYVKPTYISRNRKTVALTFDDGPSVKNTPRIIDALYKVDGNATFFVLGNQLYPETVEIIKDSIEKGNQYGSHTQSHPYLRLISTEEEYKEIVQPAIDLKDGSHEGTKYDFDGLGYVMSIYRAPYGEHKKAEETSSPYMSIEWDCDSKDWDSSSAQEIIDRVYDFESKNKDELDGCIVLFHDSHSITAEAIEIMVPELIEKGYQLITVDELLDVLNVDRTKAYYPW